MSEIQNSLSSFVKDLLTEHKNSVEIWKKFTDALNSTKETVTVNVDNGNGTIEKIQIPSFGWLKSQVERLDNNVKSLSGLGESSAINRLEDGTFQQIILNTLSREAPSITSLSVPTAFDFKNNWFFENFLNPLLYVNFNLSGQIDPKTERAIVRRYILNISNSDELDYFNVNYNNRNDIDIDSFEEDITAQGIEYFTDEEVRAIPYQENQFYGTFDVIKIFDENVEDIANITSETKRRKRYKLNKLTYSSRSSSLEETETLQVGDNLIVNTGRKNSRYRIINIETSTSIVELDIVEGYDAIKQGSETLSFYDSNSSLVNLEIPISFNERLVTFVKAIDPNSNIPASFWSPGVAIFTNDLAIAVTNDSTATLTEFYNDQVVDFGQFMLGMAKDSTPPSIAGVTPDAPQLDAANFKVVEVNQHLTQRKAFDEIRKLQNQKNNLNSEIEEIDIAVTEKREELATTKFNSNIDRSKVVTELQNFEREKQNKLKLLSSIISKINNLSSESSVGITSKYRIRGFWPLPDPKIGASGSPQEVVQFAIEYRYLSKEGDSNPIEQIEFTDNSGETQTGAQTTWIRTVSPVRRRELNEDTGQYEWADEDIKDSDAININQLDIPINRNEKVQIRIRSISEAGYPNNPLNSEYSSTIEVEFPDDLAGNTAVQDIIDEANREQVRVELDNDLASLGLNLHLSDQFTANEKFFAHTATSIDSGFLSPEQKPVALADKLIELQNEIDRLNATLAAETPDLTAVLQDEDGNTLTLSNNQKNQIFAGYYRDIVSNLSVKKGVIVNRTFFLVLQNNSSTDLKFRSNEPGAATTSPFVQFNSGQPFELYDEVPIINNEESSIFQEGQAYGQYIYFRKGGVNREDFYKKIRDDNAGEGILLSEYHYSSTVLSKTSSNTGFVVIEEGGNVEKGLLNLSDTAPGGELDNPMYIHIDHPSISVGDSIPSTADLEDIYGNSKLANIIQSNTFGIFDGNLSNSDYKLQWDYQNDLTIKQSYRANDQYLLGPGSCGAYLFPLIRNINDIRVDGDTINSEKVIGPGEQVTIPLIFQFRMTDYFGEGETGLGNVGGDYTQSIENLSYVKSLGVDLYTSDNRKFSFDLEFQAIYKAEGATLRNVTGQSFDSTSSSQDIIL